MVPCTSIEIGTMHLKRPLQRRIHAQIPCIGLPFLALACVYLAIRCVLIIHEEATILYSLTGETAIHVSSSMVDRKHRKPLTLTVTELFARTMLAPTRRRQRLGRIPASLTLQQQHTQAPNQSPQTSAHTSASQLKVIGISLMQISSTSNKNGSP